jgi:hypothetical protein
MPPGRVARSLGRDFVPDERGIGSDKSPPLRVELNLEGVAFSSGWLFVVNFR